MIRTTTQIQGLTKGGVGTREAGGGGAAASLKIFSAPLKRVSIELRLTRCEEHIHFTRRVNSLEGKECV